MVDVPQNPGPETWLSDEELARAAALVYARRALIGAPLGVLSSAGRGTVDALDLVNVARFILTGDDPWENTPAKPDLTTFAGDSTPTYPVPEVPPEPPTPPARYTAVEDDISDAQP